MELPWSDWAIPWAGIGAILLGLGSTLSGIAAVMSARRKGHDETIPSTDSDTSTGGGERVSDSNSPESGSSSST